MVQSSFGETKGEDALEKHRSSRIPPVLQAQVEKEMRGIYLTEIYTLVKHGGGFTFKDVYDMPIYMRRFFIKMINKEHREENDKNREEMEKRKNRPNFSPKVPKR